MRAGGEGRVAVILAGTALGRGGVWRHIEDLALELRERGHDVSVALRPGAIELHRAAAAHAIPVREMWSSLTARDAVWHGHLHDTYDRRFLLAALARRALGATVLTEHLPRSNASDPSLQPGRRHPLAGAAKTAFKRAQFACADAVIAVSPSSAEFLASRYGVRARVHVVTNGLRPAPEPPGPEDGAPRDGPVRVVCPGAVIDQKGHDLLVAAARRSRGGWQAAVLGDGPGRERLARETARAGLPVAFPGWCDDVATALARADIACLPSRWESAPYAALEALRAGLPLVGTDVDGLRDLIEPEVSGLLVAPEDANALAAALDRLSEDGELRHRLGAAARLRAREFTSARMTTETLAVYAAALGRRRSARA